MPNFTSHAIMATKVNQILLDNKEYKIDIDESKLCQYAVAHDYTLSKPDLFNKTHSIKSQAFFMNLMNNIIINKLYEDNDVMAYLYGQIAHFALDTVVHPMVYSIVDNPVDGIKTPHMIVEFYYDNYLAHKVENIEYREATKKYFNKLIVFTNKVKELINQTYYQTYKEKNAAVYYKVTQSAMKRLIGIINTYFKGTTIYERLLTLTTKDIESNHFINNDHKVLTSPFDGCSCTSSFDELFTKSIEVAVTMIQEANDYIYNNHDIDKVCEAFPDNSYDTGIDCKFGKKLIYGKKIAPVI